MNGLAVSREKLLLWLLDKGANPNTRARRRRGSIATRCTPLVAAAAVPGSVGLEILPSYGAEMDNMALFEAVAQRHESYFPHVQILLDNGADINCWTKEWGTPLHRAVRANSKIMVQYLLERGADASIRSVLGETPADKAKRENKFEIFELLEGRQERHT